MPWIINLLFNIGEAKPLVTTRFDHINILTYIGAVLPLFATVIFSWLVLVQNKKQMDLQTNAHQEQIAAQEKAHQEQLELQEKIQQLEQQKSFQNMANNSFAFLNIARIETTADFISVKTYKLEKAVPWPLDVRRAHLHYPNGVPDKLPNGDDFPEEWKQQIEESLPSLPMGNSENYREGEIFEKVFFHLKTELSESWLSIDPSKGIWNNGSTCPQLVLWQSNFPIPRHYEYYTSFNLTFYAKSSRENYFVSMVEIHRLKITLKKGEYSYAFHDHMYCFAPPIKEPLVAKTTTIAENVPLRNQYNCDHTFSVELHLCHGYAGLLDIWRFDEIDIQFEAVYVNHIGVRTMRQQGFKLGAYTTETVESAILDGNGVPMKRKVKKRAGLQQYSASEIEIDFDRSGVWLYET